MANVIDILEGRGLLESMTRPELREALDSPCVVYAGFDPTNASLQAGNFVAIMTLRHFQQCGHHVIALVGGATGMIGDPSGKSTERTLLDRETIRRNVAGIRENLARFLDFDHPTAPARLVNNDDWLSTFSYLDFLRDVGKHFRMGAMLGRESVRARLQSEQGLSYTEFSYQLLQAYDFLHLFDHARCTVQVGGSDQWGNITAGVELIRRLRGAEAFGVTTPLLCDGSGAKFGKSEGNAVYLDASRTSIYEFYQFFLRSADEDVERYLKALTDLPLDAIEALARATIEAPERREAQGRLAEAVTRRVHGEAGLATARRATAVLFGESIRGLDAALLLEVFSDVPSVTLARGEVEDQPVADVGLKAGLCESKNAARRLLESGGFYVNNERVGDPQARVRPGDLIEGRLLVLRSGKKRFHLVKIV